MGVLCKAYEQRFGRGSSNAMIYVLRGTGSNKHAYKWIFLLAMPGERRCTRAYMSFTLAARTHPALLMSVNESGNMLLRLLVAPPTRPYSTRDLEEMLWGMLSPAEMAREHLRALVKSMDPGGTGKTGLRELVTFIRARQGGGGAGKAGKAAETGLKRCVADHPLPCQRHTTESVLCRAGGKQRSF